MPTLPLLLLLADPRLAGCGVVLDAASGRVLAETCAQPAAAPPGSTLKPFTLFALLRAGKVTPATRFACQGATCTHPRLAAAPGPAEALAYSCNSWFEQAASRLSPDELLRAYAEFGLTGSPEVLSTPLQLAHAFRKLIDVTGDPAYAIIPRGLREAAQYGTARLATPGAREIAGKTGTTARHSWFAGWSPAAAPDIIVVIRLDGGAGGSDAAPAAAPIFEAWHRYRGSRQ